MYTQTIMEESFKSQWKSLGQKYCVYFKYIAGSWVYKNRFVEMYKL